MSECRDRICRKRWYCVFSFVQLNLLTEIKHSWKMKGKIRYNLVFLVLYCEIGITYVRQLGCKVQRSCTKIKFSGLHIRINENWCLSLWIKLSGNQRGKESQYNRGYKIEEGLCGFNTLIIMVKNILHTSCTFLFRLKSWLKMRGSKICFRKRFLSIRTMPTNFNFFFKLIEMLQSEIQLW